MNKQANNVSIITIIESDLGPLISESRATVYDVMEAYDEGDDPSEISNLTLLNKTDVLRQRVEFKSERGVCCAVDSNDCESNGSD